MYYLPSTLQLKVKQSLFRGITFSQADNEGLNCVYLKVLPPHGRITEGLNYVYLKVLPSYGQTTEGLNCVYLGVLHSHGRITEGLNCLYLKVLPSYGLNAVGFTLYVEVFVTFEFPWPRQ